MHLSLSEVNDRHNAVIVKIKKKNCHQGSNYNCVQILVLMPLCELSMCTTVRNTEHINDAIYTFIINLIFFSIVVIIVVAVVVMTYYYDYYYEYYYYYYYYRYY